ncbi:SET domain-containing protein-lysine N-methyltransferase [Streptomyces sp. NPDC056820]|uniref:SET domain-containing protein-lysine N-methyltransferase n=1 Tax=Streptomyces sp. NPDC056820 TaxID=3345951 RepID=UPI0036B6930B
MNDGYELKRTDAKGEGVFATRSFQVGETVMVGVIDREVDHNHSHASQLVPKVNHSCEPNCGIRLNASGAHDLIARWPITAGQEITFDYAMRNYSVDHFAAHCQCRGLSKNNSSISGFRWPVGCRGDGGDGAGVGGDVGVVVAASG